MPQKLIWNKEKSLQEAKKYNTKSEFSKNSPAAYAACCKNQWLKAACQHMFPTEIKIRKPNYWTRERCLKEAKKYKLKGDFIRMAPGAYAAAKRMGCAQEITAHLKVVLKRNWTKESCQQEALKYSRRKDFQIQCKGAYLFSLRRSWLDEICAHMQINFVFWDKNTIAKEALKYKTRTGFARGSGGGYMYARENGLLDRICRHMEVQGNSFRRIIYAYEFPDKRVYVGLTFNEKKRKSEHLTDKRGPVGHYILATGLKPRYRKLSDFVTQTKAKELENHFIEKYRTKGWKILNSTKAGALGGNSIKWTTEECLRVAKLYQYRKDFEHSAEHYTAYSAAAKHGWLDEVCKHMKRLRIVRWTKEEVLKEARKYKYRQTFRKKKGGAYNFSLRNGFLEEACAHMPAKLKRWTKEECRAEAAKYHFKIDFQKQFSNAYNASVRHGWYKEIAGHLKDKTKRWDEEKCRTEALKYTSRTAFLKGCGSAYAYARKNKLLEKIMGHALTKRVRIIRPGC